MAGQELTLLVLCTGPFEHVKGVLFGVSLRAG